MRQIMLCKDKASTGAAVAEQAMHLFQIAISQAGKAVFISATRESRIAKDPVYKRPIELLFTGS